MKKRQITFWKDIGNPALRGKTVELFKVSWDYDHSAWVRDADGPYWGIYKLDTVEVRRLTTDPNNMGDVTYIEEVEGVAEEMFAADKEVGVKGAVEVVKGVVEKMMAADEEERAVESALENTLLVTPPFVDEEGVIPSPEVDHLEAEDISITPEGLDLGEGE